MTNKYLLDIERLKKLAPIMEACGVEAEAYITVYYNNDKGVLTVRGNHWHKPLEYNNEPYPKNYDVYDYADLESVLPDWVFGIAWVRVAAYKENNVLTALQQAIELLIVDIKHSRGQAKLEAMADLIILLSENGIELKGKNNE